MLPYLLLIFIPILLGKVAYSKKGNGKNLVIGKSNYVKENNLMMISFFSILLLMLMLRNDSVGRDLGNYKYIFNKDIEVAEIFSAGIEPFFCLFNIGIKKITSSYQIYLSVIAFCTVCPIAKIYCEDKKYSYLKIILFVQMSTFVMLFSGIRQAWAMALGMIAYKYVRKRMIWKYLLVCMIALGIHTSAIILIFMYPIYYANFRKKHLLYLIPMIIVVFVFNRPIFGILGNVLSIFMKYSFSVSNTNAYGTLILFFVLLIFCYVISDEKKMDRESVGLRNFLIMATVIQCFAPLHTLAMRMGYYYIVFIPLAVGKALAYRKQRYSQVTKLAEIVICVFFTLTFVWSLYQSYLTGISALDTVPYVPFWID